MNYDWNQERETELGRLWAQGLTGDQIGDRFGVTRSCIIARVRKLELPRREPRSYMPVRKSEHKSKPGPKAGSRTNHVDFNALRSGQLKRLSLPRQEPCPQGTKTFMELGANDCRYAYGQRVPYAFCGAPTPEDSPYCEYHRTVCYQPLMGRR